MYDLFMLSPLELARHEALEILAELEREEASLFARKAVATVTAADLFVGRDDPAAPFLALDVAISCQVAQVTATVRIRRSRHLVEDLPGTLAGLRSRELTVGQGLAVMDETDGLSPELCAAVEREVLGRIVGLTSGDTRREVKRAVVHLDALATEVRRREQQRQRRVWTSPRPDGRGFVGAEQAAEQAGAFFRALGQLATATFDPADDRTLDQQRADVFSHLPEFALEHLEPGGTPTWHEFLKDRGVTGLQAPVASPSGVSRRRRRRARRIQAVVLVPVETALNLSDNPADLVGYGPISGAHARELLATADLRKACTDRWSGRIVALERPRSAPDDNSPPRSRAERPPPRHLAPDVELDLALLRMVLTPSRLQDEAEPQHDPSAALSALIQVRDTRCTGPGCATPSVNCDLEHAVPYPNGETSANNVGPVSRRCHNAKTCGGWILTPHPDGSVTWTSPLGRVWTSPPRHRPADHAALRFPREHWPTEILEIDYQHGTVD